MTTTNIPEVDPSILKNNAVCVYGSDDSSLENFPVLKAFQQYVDHEQSKARKRMLTLSIMFGILLSLVIVVFVILLNNAQTRTQSLNDRLIEYAMKDRERDRLAIEAAAKAQFQQPPQQPQQPVVVSAPAKDDSALMAISAQLEALQKRIVANEAKAKVSERLSPLKEDDDKTLEIRRLKALLTAEKENALKAKQERKERELEEYRRKHYPELYVKKPEVVTNVVVVPQVQIVTQTIQVVAQPPVVTQPQVAVPPPAPVATQSAPIPAAPKVVLAPAVATTNRKNDDDDEPIVTNAQLDDIERVLNELDKDDESYTLPVSVKGTNTSWQIPAE